MRFDDRLSSVTFDACRLIMTDDCRLALGKLDYRLLDLDDVLMDRDCLSDDLLLDYWNFRKSSCSDRDGGGCGHARSDSGDRC